jgi:hypothetical protein
LAQVFVAAPEAVAITACEAVRSRADAEKIVPLPIRLIVAATMRWPSETRYLVLFKPLASEMLERAFVELALD